ncbi:hypothetical protein BLOT_008968 [Blomia tropicalis]|nr:hypothetical protein BLOT_008968 [Blomia tropicalis]
MKGGKLPEVNNSSLPIQSFSVLESFSQLQSFPLIDEIYHDLVTNNGMRQNDEDKLHIKRFHNIITTTKLRLKINCNSWKTRINFRFKFANAILFILFSLSILHHNFMKKNEN